MESFKCNICYTTFELHDIEVNKNVKLETTIGCKTKCPLCGRLLTITTELKRVEEL